MDLAKVNFNGGKESKPVLSGVTSFETAGSPPVSPSCVATSALLTGSPGGTTFSGGGGDGGLLIIGTDENFVSPGVIFSQVKGFGFPYV